MSGNPVYMGDHIGCHAETYAPRNESEAPRNSAVASASVSPFGETTAKDHLASPESLDEGGSSPFKERGSLAKASGAREECLTTKFPLK